MEQAREPAFNLPPVVLGLVAWLCFIHVMVALVLPVDETERLLELFAFEPLRYHATDALEIALPGGIPAAIWTFVTYAFFHANWPHLVFNLIWLVAFGTPVARRFGAWRFLAFFVFTAAGGALAHLVTHIDDNTPAIGASAAVLGMMAAALRFVFQPGGPLGLLRLSEAETYRVPAKPLGAMLRDRRMLLFVFIWFVFNAVSALPWFAMPGIEGNVAWQAHVGGFVAGLLGFAVFDPMRGVPMREAPPAAQPADDEAPSA
ncbi:MAG TPA: rhomboid family intramembrane serine protease [Xanthobacteraceae bacterium]